jgi:uncharacterized protein (UPF0335 family)
MDSNQGKHLLSFVHRVEKLSEEIKQLNSDKSDVYKEAKRAEFNVNAIKALIKRRAADPQDLEVLEGDVAEYLQAIDAAERKTEQQPTRTPVSSDRAWIEA